MPTREGDGLAGEQPSRRLDGLPDRSEGPFPSDGQWVEGEAAAGADAEEGPPARRFVQCGHGRSRLARVAGIGVGDARADAQVLRGHGDGGHGDVHVPGGQTLVVDPAALVAEPLRLDGEIDDVGHRGLGDEVDARRDHGDPSVAPTRTLSTPRSASRATSSVATSPVCSATRFTTTTKRASGGMPRRPP